MGGADGPPPVIIFIVCVHKPYNNYIGTSSSQHKEIVSTGCLKLMANYHLEKWAPHNDKTQDTITQSEKNASSLTANVQTQTKDYLSRKKCKTTAKKDQLFSSKKKYTHILIFLNIEIL